MALPQPTDPANPANPAPIFVDNSPVRGDHLRGNNQFIWQNFNYLDASQINKPNPVLADSLVIVDSVGNLIKNTLMSAVQNLFFPLIYPTGSFLNFAGTSAPSGFLVCNGSAVSRSTYANLFAIINTIYGVGDGSTTFNLPDARGLVMVGAGTHGTMTRANGTAFNGGSVGASRNDQFQGHVMSASSGTVFLTSPGGSVNQGNASLGWNVASTTGGPATDGANGTPRIGDETRPAEIATLVCIKY